MQSVGSAGTKRESRSWHAAALATSFAWSLLGDGAALDVAREPGQVRFSLVVPPPDEELPKYLVRLLATPGGTLRPALAMLLDRDSRSDGELLLQGPQGLTQVPPLFYLDEHALEAFGGRQRMRSAPCAVEELPGGLLFVVRTSPFERPSKAEEAMRLVLTGARPAREEPRWTVEQFWPEGADGMPFFAGGCGWGDAGWIVGEAGLAVRRDGAAWTAMETGGGRTLLAVWGAGPDDVWAVGEGGTILRWRGDAWTSEKSPTGASLNGVRGSGPDQVFAVGDGGTVLRWDGRMWSAVESGTREDLLAVSNAGPEEAWAVGAAGTLLRWDGKAWRTSASPVDVTLCGVCISAAGEGWAVGLDGTVLRLRGGVWKMFDSGTDVDLRAVWSRGGDQAWAVGDGCTIRRWDGRRWTTIESETQEQLLAAWGDGGDGVWTTGSDAVILQVKRAD